MLNLAIAVKFNKGLDSSTEMPVKFQSDMEISPLLAIGTNDRLQPDILKNVKKSNKHTIARNRVMIS